MYSTHQMHDCLAALASAAPRETSLMLFCQFMKICALIRDEDHVLDLCCGRAQVLAFLAGQSKRLSSYLGMDVSLANIQEAALNAASLSGELSFRPRFVVGDASFSRDLVTQKFDVVLYTCALEHLPRERALMSLESAVHVLKPGGLLLISTPNTRSGETLQHRVHVHEWSRTELVGLFSKLNLRIELEIGLLPRPWPEVADELTTRFGEGALRFAEELRTRYPESILSTILAGPLRESTREILWACRNTG